MVVESSHRTIITVIVLWYLLSVPFLHILNLMVLGTYQYVRTQWNYRRPRSQMSQVGSCALSFSGLNDRSNGEIRRYLPYLSIPLYEAWDYFCCTHYAQKPSTAFPNEIEMHRQWIGGRIAVFSNISFVTLIYFSHSGAILFPSRYVPARQRDFSSNLIAFVLILTLFTVLCNGDFFQVQLNFHLGFVREN